MDRIELKQAIVDTIALKRKNTQERIAYKKANPADPACPGDYKRMDCIRSYWNENSILKEQLRHYGLAYAYLRGRRYWVTERFTKDAPSAYAIAHALGDHTREDEVRAWLEAQPSEEERLAFEQHVAAAKEKASREYQARSLSRRAA